MPQKELETLFTRRSVRQYRAAPVPAPLLHQVLEAGLHAPSAHDSRPWQFCVFQGNAKQQLLRTLAAPFEQDMRRAGFNEAEIARRLQRSQQIFCSAPVLILALGKQKLPQNPLDRHNETNSIEHTLMVQSLALAGGQMLQAAHALGLGMCWFAAPLFCGEPLCSLCGVQPQEWQPQYLLSLGWPDAQAQPKPKAPIQFQGSVVFYE